MAVELPFTLTHPKPEPPIEAKPEAVIKVEKKTSNGSNDQQAPVDHNLIEFDTTVHPAHADDDLIFEEFARIRLKGHEPDDIDV